MPRRRHERVLLCGETVGTATIGLLYLAGYLRRHGIEASCQWNDTARTAADLRRRLQTLLTATGATLVGVSLEWFPHMARALEICRLVKELAPGVETVLGGNTASYYAADLARHAAVDHVIRGDGERFPLLRLCQGATDVPNLVGGRALPQFEYRETATTDDVFLSHLDEIFVDPEDARRCDAFFIYTGKRCNKKCFYCGGCATAMHASFGSAHPFFRLPALVRHDLDAARPHAPRLFFDFDYEPEGISQEDYFREIFTAPWLREHHAYFAFWRIPHPGTIDFLAATFGGVTIALDLASLSERHRLRLVAEPRLGVKPQPTDDEILAIFAQADRHPNLTLDVNLIAGMPLLGFADLDDSLKMVHRLIAEHTSLEEIQWGPLHAQPGAPILDHCADFGMRASARTFEDFLRASERNLALAEYPDWRRARYPYIVARDQRLRDASLRHYAGVNRLLEERRAGRARRSPY